MFLSKVTITGADNSVEHKDLVRLQAQYPFVEWGILFSKAKMASPRYPSFTWLEKLAQTKQEHPELRLSGHICGRWVRDICEGNWTILQDLPFMDIFDRYQLNFHSYVHKIQKEAFLDGLRALKNKEFIFQLDDVNNNLLTIAEENNIKAAGLFDTSGGAGILPESWPTSNKWIGYAGGLGPECLNKQLSEIAQVAQGEIWIDVETKVRTFDERLDLEKTEQFLKISSLWIYNV